MALLTPQTVVPGGLTPTYSAVNASDTFVPGDHVFLHVKNTSGGSTVTVSAPTGLYCNLGVTGTGHNLVVSVTAGQERMIGPLTANRFMDPTTGLATVGYSPTANTTAALVVS